MRIIEQSTYLAKRSIKRMSTRLGIQQLAGELIPTPIVEINGHPVMFIHIPKTAGTSITSALGYDTLPHDTGKFTYTKTGQEIPIPKPKGLYPVHNTLKETAEYVFPGRFRSAFKFGIIRNPWDYAVSLYNYFIKINKCRMADLPVDFNTWVEWVYGPQKHAYYYYIPKFFESYHHWLSLDGETIGVDFVGKLENIDKDWAYICKQLGTEIPLPERNRSKKKVTRHDMFNERSRELIADVYAKDIAYWGYSFDD